MQTLGNATPSFVKMFLIGDSGSGKTGALASLVEEGYNLYVVDMDQGLNPLAQILAKKDQSLLDRVAYQSISDTYRKGELQKADAYNKACNLLDKWPEVETKPSEFGPDSVFVVDSLTLLGRAAFNDAQTKDPKNREPRRWYFSAQTMIENYMACVFGADFHTNVIVISHITDVELNDGTTRGFPAAIGKSLSRHIAKYSNDLFVVETKGMGDKTRRVIRTVPNQQTDARTAARTLDKELPIETGMATIFKALRMEDANSS